MLSCLTDERARMKLKDMSYMYATDACIFRERITALREQAKSAETDEEVRRLKHRIEELQVLLRQSRELADLTQHYYERSYYRNAKYTL